MLEKSTINNFPYLYRGIVLDNKDPKNLGRCKIRIPSIHGSINITPEMLPWARAITRCSYNESRGSYSIPDLGDIVWLFFEGGDMDSPVYVGGSIGAKDIPVDIDNVLLYQDEETSLIYNKKFKFLTIRVSGTEILLNEGTINISSSNSINIKSPSVNIEGDLRVNGNPLN